MFSNLMKKYFEKCLWARWLESVIFIPVPGRAKRCEPTRPRCQWRTVKPSARTRASKTKPREKGGPLSLSLPSLSLSVYGAEFNSVGLNLMPTLSRCLCFPSGEWGSWTAATQRSSWMREKGFVTHCLFFFFFFGFYFVYHLKLNNTWYLILKCNSYFIIFCEHSKNI